MAQQHNIAQAEAQQPYLRVGNGPRVVVALSGWFGHGADWGFWQEVLDQENFTWIFPDYRGYGARIDVPGNYSLDEVSDDTLALIAQLQAEGVLTEATPLILLGHTMGGVYMQHTLLKLRQGGGEGEYASLPQVAAIVGLNPVGALGSTMPEQAFAFYSTAGEQPQTRRAIMDMLTGNRLSSTWLNQMMHSSAEHSRGEAVDGYFQSWVRANFLEELGTVDIPALVIVGAHDRAITAEAVSKTYGSTYPDCTILELPDAGHYVMQEAPLRVAAEVERFLLDKLATPTG
ncbi:alpha/beta hydrolase [Corynebacterium sp. 153RC1]|uniref:alpha/beta fold hydrolase n=1 Tax=unclassified Corynebacterium TaxID=2624378 RepID=UPI00211C4814|nr:MULTISPECIES: alpha/beta hydrolase [unclassified Corynebacterium]MCQ9353177.1 alpha/beta hydrolase [Corynebacterium sp. 209RC1]MCQ9353884.1 alpha/beta hydrolase [Corynebacterium sp. 1222RC1]MCQ9356915.1 alpha/beta hydrolase [Corynebacterium sp. 122RC1]MCQ9359753.1 alpha/beta hydrolase [Corynebacterium sp. 142RC1]MCQ9361383.1 alpha/beta hydrolase [Corynebacterium sp. 153RC1]